MEPHGMFRRKCIQEWRESKDGDDGNIASAFHDIDCNWLPIALHCHNEKWDNYVL